MNARYLKSFKIFERLIAERKKPKAIIVDLDKTLAIFSGRDWRDFKLCFTDKLNRRVYNIVAEEFNKGTNIIILTGRPQKSCERETRSWLYKHGIPYSELYMRPPGEDNDKNFKENTLKNIILQKYNVKFAIDDTPEIIEMFKKNGIVVFEVSRKTGKVKM